MKFLLESRGCENSLHVKYNVQISMGNETWFDKSALEFEISGVHYSVRLRRVQRRLVRDTGMFEKLGFCCVPFTSP